MPEHELPGYEACAVCGRSFLRGEEATEFITAEGETMTVCPLCLERAGELGWTRGDLLDRAPPGPKKLRRGLPKLRLRDRFSRRREGEARPTVEEEPQSDPEVEEVEYDEPAGEDSLEENQSAAKEAAAEEPPAAAEPVMEEPPPTPDTPERRMSRALERFNQDPERPRMVAGLIRTLGPPRASVRELQDPPRAEITIAWELSWYRWELGRGGAGDPRQVAKGAAVEELADDALDWNATADEEGRLRWRENS